MVVPVLNEEAVILEFYYRIKKVLEETVHFFEIIFIDDGSQDTTLQKLKDLRFSDNRIRIISFSRNFGHAMAISAGIEYASGEAVVIIDGDLQDPPEVILKFLEKWEEGYPVVYGIRRKRKEWFGKRLAYWTFYRIFQKLAFASLTNTPLDAGDFCLMDRPVVEVIKNLPERNRFLRGLRSWTGFRQYGVEYERAARFAGSTKYPLKKLIKLAADGIFSFSYIPLRIATLFGFFVAIAAFAGIIFVLYLRLVKGLLGTVGYYSTVISVLFIGGIQLISVGILGEYIARIYEEVKQRPLYIIKEKIGWN